MSGTKQPTPTPTNEGDAAIVGTATTPAPALTDAERDKSAEKYKPTPAAEARNKVLDFFAPIRAMIIHAVNGDRNALGSVLHLLADLHQTYHAEDAGIPPGVPLDTALPSDHLRAAGAAVTQGRTGDATAALTAAAALLAPGPASDATAAAQAAIAAGEDDGVTLKAIDAALTEAMKIEGPVPAPTPRATPQAKA